MLFSRDWTFRMRVIFMGSAEFACPAVEALLGSRHELVACVTQPDRPKGRRLKVQPCPVRALAEAKGVRVLAPEAVDGAYDEIATLRPDLIAVAAYGQYIPGRLIDLPPRGAINIHPSLLPRYRGAAPIQWAVANGDTVTGVSILYVGRKMDAGDVILQQEHDIADGDTAATLAPRLARAGAELLVRAIDLIDTGHAHRTPQDEAKVTWARKLEKADGRIDWTLPALALHHRVRGFQPWPGSACEAQAGSGHHLKVLRTRVEQGTGVPGTILDATGDGPLIACGENALRLLDVQPEGKRPMPGAAYLNGAHLPPGSRLG